VRIEELDPMKTIGILTTNQLKSLSTFSKVQFDLFFSQTMHDVIAMDDFEVPMESTIQKYIKSRDCNCGSLKKKKQNIISLFYC
jgi:hypothetical protein